MQTVPAAIQNHDRTGPYCYAVEIAPRSGDSWSEMRYAGRELYIDDEIFEGGYLKPNGVSRITNSADIREAGAGVTKDSVSFDIINRDRHHNTYIANGVLGRRVTIWYCPIGLNRLLNSSFERFVVNDFENWTENTPGAGSAIIAGSGPPPTCSHGDGFVWMLYGGTPPVPTMTSDAFTMKKGEYLSISLDSKALTNGDKFRLQVKVNGSYWWDFVGRQLSISAKYLETSVTTSWTRYNLESLHWSELGLPDSDLTCSVQIILTVETTGDLVYFDAVLCDPHPEYRGYVPNPRDLTSSDILMRYTGEVKDFSWTRSIIHVNTNSVLDIYHRDIPVTVLTQEIDSTWNIPPDNVGKPFPMTYGAFLRGAFNPDGSYIPASQENAFGLLCNDANELGDVVTAHFDRPGMSLKDIYVVEHYVQGARKYIQELWDDRSSPTYVEWEWDKDASNAKAYANANAHYLPANKFPFSIYMRPRRITTGQWTDSAYAFDYDPATYAYINPVPVGPGAKLIYYQLDNFSGLSGEVIDIFALAKCYMNGVSGGTKIEFIVTANNPTRWLANDILTADGWFNNIPWEASVPDKETDISMFAGTSTVPEVFRNLSVWVNTNELIFTPRLLQGNAGGVAYLFEVSLRIDGTLDLYDAVIAGMLEGREFQDTWGGRRTSGDMIENPIDVVESVIRDELSVPSTDINTTIFDAQLSNRASWKAAGQLVNEQMSSEDWMDEFCSNFGLLYFIDLNGKQAISALDHEDPALTLRTEDFRMGSIKVGYTEREQVVNRFILKYDYNPKEDFFAKAIYCNKNDSSFSGADATEYEGKCQTSYDALGGVELPREFEAKWIHDDNTALLLLKWLINWNYLQRITVEGDVFPKHMGIEVSDKIALDLPEYLPETITGSSVFIIEKERPAADRSGKYLSMFEIKEP